MLAETKGYRDGWLGDFDFKFLCSPQLPFGNARKYRSAAPFYGLNDDLPLLVTIVVGFQSVIRTWFRRRDFP